LKDKTFTAITDLAERYQHGFVMFGLVEDHFSYAPRLHDVSVIAEWDKMRVTIDRSNKTLLVLQPPMQISRDGLPTWYEGNVEYIPFTENKPQQSFIRGMF